MLSKYKVCYCPNCQESIKLSLGIRRGDVKGICSGCKNSFSIEEIEEYNNDLSSVTNGDCPNCSTSLKFEAYHRGTKDKIVCYKCREQFYLNEVENPRSDILKTVESNTYSSNPPTIIEKLLSNYRLYIVVSIFLDFFFLFTILALVERSRISKMVDESDSSTRNSLNNWTLLLIVLIALKVLGAISVLTEY